MTKILMISAALFGVALSTVDANSTMYRKKHVRVMRAHSSPGTIHGLGLGKQTKTGGPSGGSKNGGSGQ